MEIKKNILLIPLILYSQFSIALLADDNIKDIPIEGGKNSYSQDEYSNLGRPDSNNVKEYKLVQNSSVIYFNNNVKLGDGVKRIGKYAFEMNKGKLAEYLNTDGESEFILEPKLKLLIDSRNNSRILISDGSFIVRSSKRIDFEELAKMHNLTLLRTFPSIDSAVFQAKNFAEVEDKMNSIQKINNIIYIQHNFIDPNKIPE
ncbi:MAG: hypothetical protein CBD46_004170 [Gammaproteobacteria bacterium TMED186]|nr:MAG: hypothetical protein CBD46_004170 [Gammaproteobacteria bacterium TMED186]